MSLDFDLRTPPGGTGALLPPKAFCIDDENELTRLEKNWPFAVCRLATSNSAKHILLHMEPLSQL